MFGQTCVRVSLGFLFVVFLCGCGPTPRQGDGAGAAPLPVSVAHAVLKEVSEWDEYTGRLEAVDEVAVRARVSGYLESVHFKDGAMVEEGDLLFVIDPRPYEAVLNQARAAVDQARARLQLAENELTRARRLFDSRAISEEELDSRTQSQREAQAALEEAGARVAEAELSVEFTQVRAPVSGRISRKRVTDGNLISGGSADSTLLTTIVSLDPIYVYFTADERAYLHYVRLDKQGQRPSSRDVANPVRMQLADEEGFPHIGQMDFVDNRIDEATGTMEGRAIFSNPDLLLIPGLFARLQLLGEGPYAALMLPDEAINTDQAQRFVYVLDEQDIARRQVVQTGKMIGGLRVIRSGINQHDRVIVKGLMRVRPGSAVKPELIDIAANQTRDAGEGA